ncbi:uncharacterized protein VTP21DRAFT_7250 [Calcarisporiella thermophila]|uniref:uncharacterized protein n=1 Tax=Calcarisporiella thermophila TaxID=911321 RepID=UPI0037436060
MTNQFLNQLPFHADDVDYRPPSPYRVLATDGKAARWLNARRGKAFYLIFLGVLALYFLMLVVSFFNGPRVPYVDIKYSRQTYPQPETTWHSYTPDEALKLPDRMRGKNVYHITKEFGPASLTDIGDAVTSLAAAQLDQGLRVSVVMPNYSFLSGIFGKCKGNCFDLSVTVPRRVSRRVQTEFKVMYIPYKVNPASNKTVDLYLISWGDTFPYKRAFRVQSPENIYTAPDGITNEWSDLYFAKAAASFLIYKHMIDDEPLFNLRPRRLIDLVHVHGPFGANIGRYLRDSRNGGWGRVATVPAMVHTLHDPYHESLQHCKQLSALLFSDGTLLEEEARLHNFTQDAQVYLTAIALQEADLTILPSSSYLAGIERGVFDWPVNELVAAQMMSAAANTRLRSVTHGFSLREGVDPFGARVLRELSLAFPPSALPEEYAARLPPPPPLTPVEGEGSEVPVTETPFQVVQPEVSRFHTLLEAKTSAKRYLIDEGILSKNDLSRPIFLFEARPETMEMDMITDVLRATVRSINELDARLVVATSDPAVAASPVLKNLVSRGNANHVTLVRDPVLPLLRAAADYAFFPLPLEGSLISHVAENLLYGATAVSAYYPEMGRHEFLTAIPRYPSGVASANAHLFDISAASSEHNSLHSALSAAVEEWRTYSKTPDLNERRLVSVATSVLDMTWGVKHGAAANYLKLYGAAIGFSRRQQQLEQQQRQQQRQERA